MRETSLYKLINIFYSLSNCVILKGVLASAQEICLDMYSFEKINPYSSSWDSLSTTLLWKRCSLCLLNVKGLLYDSLSSFISQELFPVNRQSVDHFAKYFTDAGLKELSDFLRVQQSLGTRKELQKELQERLSQECPIKEVRTMGSLPCKTASEGRILDCAVQTLPPVKETALRSLLWTWGPFHTI